MAGYDVYRDGTLLGRVAGTSAPGTSLAAGVTTAFTVSAVDGAGNVSRSSGAVHVTTPPCAGVPPIADAGPNHATQTLTPVAFDGGASHDADGTVVAWAWAFGDGGVASGKSTTHAYTTAGTYTVTLTVTDDDGVRASDTATVIAANRSPLANAGPDRSGAPGVAVSFDGSASSDPDGSVAGWAWSFGDGATASGVHASHVFQQAGTYTVRLTVTDDRGAQSNDTAAVVVAATADPHVWSRAFGGATFVDGVTVNGIATAADGTVLVTGFFSGTVDFGRGPVTSAGGNDVFVAAFASGDGQLAWVRRFGGTGHDFGASVAVGASGDVVVTGGFTGVVDFGGGALTSAGSYDAFLVRLSPTGAHRWARRGGGTGDDSGSVVALDASGDVVVAGTFTGSASVGGGTLISAGSRDIFLARHAGASGAHVWSSRYGGGEIDTPEGLVVDADGSIVLGAVFRGGVSFGGSTLSSAGGGDVALARYAGATGAHVWSKRFGGTGDDQLSGLALGAAGDLVLVGQYAATIDFGGGALANAGAPDVFVARLTAAAAHRWSRHFGTASSFALVATGVAVDADGAVAFAGGAIEAVDFGGGTLAASGGFDPYVVKLDAAGTHLWSERAGSSNYPYNYSAGLALDGDGNVLSTGCFSGGIDLGDGLLRNAGGLINQSYDGFLAKHRP